MVSTAGSSLDSARARVKDGPIIRAFMRTALA
jgi:hypothetical protein